MTFFSVQGFRDLFWLPVEQYRKDGRIVRGLQRGAQSFTTSTAMAALELTNRLVQSLQVLCVACFLPYHVVINVYIITVLLIVLQALHICFLGILLFSEINPKSILKYCIM